MEQHTVQINAPDFDPDIDGQNTLRAHNNTVVVSLQEQLTSPEPELADATNFQEETPDRDPLNPHTIIQRNPMGMIISPSTFQTMHQYIISWDNTRSLQGTTSIQKKIPLLEEDWDNGQFANTDTNLINIRNTHSESERIRKEYTEHLCDLSDNQYYFEENPINQLQYSSPNPDYYGTPSRRSQTQPCDPTGYYPSPQSGRGKHTLLHRHRLLSEKTQ